MKHEQGTRAGMSLYITSDSNTTGTVSIPGQSWSKNFTVTANNLTVVNVDVPKAYISCEDCIESKGVKVVADDNIIVYSHHYEGNKSDATLVLPTRTLGKKYYLVGYQESTGSDRSEFIIVGTKANTKIDITPSVALKKSGGGTRAAGTKYQITLNEGQVYQGIVNGSSDDVTGTLIEVIDTGATANCRTVAVFAGSSYTRIGGCSGGWGANSGDNLYEQMFPTSSWGKKFVLVPALGRASDNFRILGSVDGTEVFVFKNIGPPTIGYIDEGEYFDVNDESTIRYVLATEPVSVAQFQKTSKCDGGSNRVGDPSMTILNPLEQTLKDITLYSSRYYDIDKHYINVVIPTGAATSFRIDGVSKTFTAVPKLAGYSYARFEVTSGNHRLTANQGFIATAYGEGRYESYGYAAGANVKDLTAVASVTNSPLANAVTGCVGRPTKFGGTAEYDVVKWEWDFGDGSIDSIQNPSHIYTDTGT
ncbi:MAG: PKD domain-containing protein, partial [Bacteroidia bacterium]